MNELFDLRRENLRALLRQNGGPKSLHKKLGHTNGSFLTQLAGPNPSRNISEKIARGIESSLSLSEGWMDVAHGQSSNERQNNPIMQSLAVLMSAFSDGRGSKLSEEPFGELCALVLREYRLRGEVKMDYVERLLRLVGSTDS